MRQLSFRSLPQAQPPTTYIDNQAPEGFIDFFRKQDCLSGCSHCIYCQKIADKVVQLDCNEASRYVSVLGKFIGDLTGNDVFKKSDSERIRRHYE